MTLALQWGLPIRPLTLRWATPAGALPVPPTERDLPGFAVVVGTPSATAAPYIHTQASASATWTINHNLARTISNVTVLTVGGVEMDADVIHVSNNQTVINFAAPFAGTARLI